MSSDTPLNQDQKDALANTKSKQETLDEGPQLGYDLSRSYGRNWTKTNVNTLFDWLTVSAFNMQCLEYAIDRHRSSIRNYTVYSLIVSTLSGTISLSQFGIDQVSIGNKLLQGIFTFFTFSMAIYTGYVKIYQIQELLEKFIKLRQDWAIFATAIGSELQLPIELRRDALHLIIKYKTAYLDLIKIDIEIPESLRIRAEQSLPKTDSHIQVTNLPSTIINIGIQEMDDLNEERRRDKDRFSVIKTDTLRQVDKKELTITKPINQLVIKSFRSRDLPPPSFMADITSPVALETIPELEMSTIHGAVPETETVTITTP